jgi:hypothetical protein
MTGTKDIDLGSEFYLRIKEGRAPEIWEEDYSMSTELTREASVKLCAALMQVFNIDVSELGDSE